MTKIMFICHGNICRSPMAEFVMKDIVKKQGKDAMFSIASSATSSEEIGNPVHYGTVNKLKEYKICTKGKYAEKLKAEDYYTYDYLIGMEQRNISNILRIVGGDSENKIFRLLDFSKHPRDIADPWYTGDFDTTYNDITEGCHTFFQYLLDGRQESLW